MKWLIAGVLILLFLEWAGVVPHPDVLLADAVRAVAHAITSGGR